MEAIDPDNIASPAFVVAQRCDPMQGAWHVQPHRAQLIHTNDGVFSLHTEGGLWIVPAGRAVWVPAGQRYRIASRRALHRHVLYAFPAAVPSGDHCHVVEVDLLVDQLLAAAAAFHPGYAADGPAARLIAVLLDRLPLLGEAPLGLAFPRDVRLQRIAATLNADPSDPSVLDAFAAAAGVTSRTAARLFLRETGQTFGQWRQQLRLLIALERLGTGSSVTQVALEVGYRDVSSFIAVFKALLGETPARYFR